VLVRMEIDTDLNVNHLCRLFLFLTVCPILLRTFYIIHPLNILLYNLSNVFVIINYKAY